MNGGLSEYWVNCTRCNTYVNTYIPQPHQEAVHNDGHTFIGNFGGYGTGKTTVSRQELIKHVLITPKANALVCSQGMAQYEQTLKRELEADLPAAFVKGVSVQKQYIDLINGARIMFRPLDDPDKLRSLNLSMFIILEASETNEETFTQLKTRLRSKAASVPKLDPEGNIVYEVGNNGVQVPAIKTEWLKGIIESNPGTGWIRTELLYVSSDVHRHGNALADFDIPDAIKDNAISSHVTSTDCNAYLPHDFIERMCKNKPTWWIARYILSSFEYAEGLVYPSANHHVEATFEVPKEWKRIIAADYGLSDDFVYLYGAIDDKDGVVHIYKEVRTNNKSIEELAKIFHANVKDIPIGGYYTQPLLDPKSGAKRDYDKKTLYDHFADYDIMFQPGHIQVDARVFRVNTYLESGRLKIMDCCTDLIGELREYKFPDRKLGASEKAAQKPVDKNNHGINPLEWICMALPADPRGILFGAYDRHGNDLRNEQVKDKKVWCPVQLMDNEDFAYEYAFTSGFEL